MNGNDTEHPIQRKGRPFNSEAPPPGVSEAHPSPRTQTETQSFPTREAGQWERSPNGT